MIVLRQSPDWARLTRRYLDEADAFDLLTSRPPGSTRALIELWDSTFDVSFFATRQAMKEIALAGFAAVRDTDLLTADEALPSSPPELVLFSDDDDWFAPDIVADLRRRAEAHDGFIWTTVRFDGLLRPTDLERAFCNTNNYAVTQRFASRNPDWPTLVGQHWDAGTVFRGEGFDDLHVPLPLSISNKHPCSTSELTRAMSRRPGRDGLVALVQDFNARAEALRLPPALAWAAPRIEAVCAFFADLEPRRLPARAANAP